MGGAGSPLLQIDLRHLGGAVGESAADAGALAYLSGEFPPSPPWASRWGPDTEAIAPALEGMAQALEPWSTGLSST